MKKTSKIITIILCMLSVFLSTINVSAAGYDVIMEPQVDYIDGKIIETSFDGTPYEIDTYFYPTPFYKGFSVVHSNVRIMPGLYRKYYDKTSYVVDSYGNKVDVGTYDCLGVWPFWFDENPSEYYEGYNNPDFNPNEGVDTLGYITVVKNGKGGLIDTQGNIIIPCEYDDLYDGAYDLYGVNYQGTLIKTEEYNGKYFYGYSHPYSYDTDSSEHIHYYNGLAIVAESQDDNAKVGIVDKNDNIIVPFIYDMITPCYDKVCWALKDGKWGIITVNNQSVTVKVDNEDVVFDQIPLIINGRTLAPLRAIFEKLGATVEWDDTTKTITSVKGDTVITMTIDKNEMYVNGNTIHLDVAPQIVGERTLVPVRAISEAFNCDVSWDEETNTVLIKQ